MFLLHTLISYWETYISPQATPSTPAEYLAAVCLFGLMFMGLDRLLALEPIPVRKD
jgi:hypothetical protein